MSKEMTAEEYLNESLVLIYPQSRKQTLEWIQHYGDLRAREAVAPLRQRLFNQRQVEGCSHSTACSIWGDDGQGHTTEEFSQPLPCNCGALANWAAQRAVAELRCKKAEDWAFAHFNDSRNHLGPHVSVPDRKECIICRELAVNELIAIATQHGAQQERERLRCHDLEKQLCWDGYMCPHSETTDVRYLCPECRADVLAAARLQGAEDKMQELRALDVEQRLGIANYPPDEPWTTAITVGVDVLREALAAARLKGVRKTEALTDALLR